MKVLKGARKLSRSKTLPPEGVRIIQTSTRHSEAIEILQHNLRNAEERNKDLNEKLERIQEKIEQHIRARHPLANRDSQDLGMREQSLLEEKGDHNILSARVQSIDVGMREQSLLQDNHDHNILSARVQSMRFPSDREDDHNILSARVQSMRFPSDR